MALDSGKIVQVNAFYFIIPAIVYGALAFWYYISKSTDESALWVPSYITALLFLIMTALGLTVGKKYAEIQNNST